MKINVRKDAEEIVKRLKQRNPDFFEHIKDESISLEDLIEIAIVQYKSFNNIK